MTLDPLGSSFIETNDRISYLKFPVTRFSALLMWDKLEVMVMLRQIIYLTVGMGIKLFLRDMFAVTQNIAGVIFIFVSAEDNR